MRVVLINKPNFGKSVYWPGCTKSMLICELMGLRTFPEKHLDKLRMLGYEIEIVGKENLILEPIK